MHCSRWGVRGRQPFASTDELQEIATELMSVRGSTIGREELAQKLERRREARLAAEGLSTIGVLPPPARRPSPTQKPPSGHAGFCNTKRPVHTAYKRLIAETSLVSAVAFATTAGATRFMPPEYLC